MHLAGCLPLESEDEVFAVEREIVVSQKVADTLFGIRDRSGRVRYEQLEALARWHTREPEAILLRSCTIVLQKELEESALGLSVVCSIQWAFRSGCPRSSGASGGRYRSGCGRVM